MAKRFSSNSYLTCHMRLNTHTHAVLSLLCAYLTCAKSFSWEKINKPLNMCHLTRTDPNMTAPTIHTHIVPSTTDVSCDSALHFSIQMYYMVLLRQSWYYKSEINMTGLRWLRYIPAPDLVIKPSWHLTFSESCIEVECGGGLVKLCWCATATFHWR